MYKVFSRWHKGGDGAGLLRKTREVMQTRWEEPLTACLSPFWNTWTMKHLCHRAGKTWQDLLATECLPTTEASDLTTGPVDPYRTSTAPRAQQSSRSRNALSLAAASVA